MQTSLPTLARIRTSRMFGSSISLAPPDLVRTYPEDQTPPTPARKRLGGFMDAMNARPEEAEASAAGAESVLACNCCRRRKLRCSRELPVCQQCRKTGSECEYKGEKSRPGMKPGAIENLHRRLDSLETSIEELKSQPQQQHHGGDVPTISGSSILSLLAQELQRLNDRSNRGLAERHQTPITFNENPYEAPNPSPRKRRRTDGDLPPPTYDASGMPPLPPHSTLEVVIETYFSHVHPWIPMLQKARFHQRLSDSSERPRLLVILQAMMVAAMRYVDVSSVGGLFGKQDIDAARNWVISTAMSSLVIESLQALTIIAFNDIGNGEEMRAWSVIGSLTRTVEYLQLTVESEEVERPPLSKPFMSLSPHEECVWIETEERRRVFWNIFNLDRFCSISMGWNTSLTSNDVHRRLPCDISLWWQDEPVVTPYFNIWDKSAGRIGNPIAFLPSHYGSSGQNNTSSEDDKGTPMESGLSPTGSVPSINMSTVGAFAYSVEATESLSQVTTYFLQQKVNMRDQREIGSWLTRFKELDLRLIHWKMFLPQKWKADMARQSIRMDPNLTLAHITHNTSIILLHQPIVFPPIAWSFSARLPSSSSAETCHTAAVEVSSITRNYLKTVPSTLPVANQFAFCVFISARVLLIYWRYYSGSALASEFPALLNSLDEMSRLWSGFDSPTSLNLAGKYAETLRHLHQKSIDNEFFRINPSGYTTEISHAVSSAPTIEPSRLNRAREQNGHGKARMTNQHGELRTMLSVPGTSGGNSEISEMESNSTEAYHQGVPHGDLSTISQMFSDQNFIDVDRIISFNDGMFDAGYGGPGWS